jgi:CheY-like chemotaxis protein
MPLPMHRELEVSQADPIVIIDDDVAVRNSLQFSLEVEGYAVRAYEGAGKLLDEADLPRCGCLIIDYSLPDIDGLTALDNGTRRAAQPRRPGAGDPHHQQPKPRLARPRRRRQRPDRRKAIARKHAARGGA